MGTIEPDPQIVEAFLAAEESPGPIVMINLLRYREQADYPADAPESLDTTPCSGRDAYQRYGAGVGPMIAQAGGRILFMGAVQATVIAPDGEQWHDAVLVEYPSRRSFFEMVSRPDYLAIAHHRKAGLCDSRLIATTKLASAVG
ncbi:MAG: DUF1330 domain-containing protein [Myxococcota bacterium]|nr:DUF1330 domain-containing protein [Myxococcota bacterium]